MKLQRRVWQGQRVAWALMAFIVLAALLGLIGSGPLSRRSVSSADGALRVEYERYLRRGAKTTLRIHARPTDTEPAAHAMWLGRSYLEAMTVEGVLPPPQRAQAVQDRVVWSFEVSQGAPSQALVVTIHFVPTAIGRLGGSVGLDAGPGIGFGHWVYP